MKQARTYLRGMDRYHGTHTREDLLPMVPRKIFIFLT